jgi:hypothetical protein
MLRKTICRRDAETPRALEQLLGQSALRFHFPPAFHRKESADEMDFARVLACRARVDSHRVRRRRSDTYTQAIADNPRIADRAADQSAAAGNANHRAIADAGSANTNRRAADGYRDAHARPGNTQTHGDCNAGETTRAQRQHRVPHKSNRD